MLAVAAMRVTRGAVRGCEPVGAEQVVHRDARVVLAMTTLSEEMRRLQIYRVCRVPAGRFQPLTVTGGGGGGGGSDTRLSGFTSAGRWVAWATRTIGHPSAGHSAAVHVRDFGDLAGTAGHEFADRSDDHFVSIEVTELALAPTGTIAWATKRADPEHLAVPGRTPVTTWTLNVAAPGGERVALDSTTDRSALTDIALSADGATVTWRNGGVERSATLP